MVGNMKMDPTGIETGFEKIEFEDLFLDEYLLSSNTRFVH